jgi:DNA invertase Pin-like site-specific DNA recombinase
MAVALYARVSTTRQAENDLSIPDQLRQMRDYCKAHGLAVAAEYVEPGASGTDDRRPVFQQMIADASLSPPPFDAIVVHSLSRFFRDALEFGLYERKLKRCGVKVISVTQQTGDEPSGEMARKLFSLFDEYQSKENAKHTLRAMKENARQGFWNGSRAPFGYRVVDVGVTGPRGRQKRRLEADPAEAEIVRRIFDLYLHGLNGRCMGMKTLTTYLNDHGITMRCRPWRMQKVDDLLCDRVYIGEFFFNRNEARTTKIKPPAEWIKVEVPAIIDEETFNRAAAMRHARHPSRMPGQRLASPALLVGLIKCGHCGACMTQATGKSGRYRYYKCTTRLGIGAHRCKARNLSREPTERAVLTALADRVFTPKRVETMLRELRKRQGAARPAEDARLRQLKRELKDVDAGIARLYEAVEKGLLPLDTTLQGRSQKLQARRQDILVAIASLREKWQLPLSTITPAQVERFARALQTRLLDTASGFGKAYLNLLVDEIRLDGNELRIQGNYGALARAVSLSKEGKLDKVPSFVPVWHPGHESNVRPVP